MPIHVDVPTSNDPGSNLQRHTDEATNSRLSELRQRRQGHEFDLPAAELAIEVAHARVVADVRNTAGWLARAARIPRADRVRVELRYTPGTRRTRDADNLVALLKPLVDGLVDAGVVADDDDEHVERTMPVITALDRSAVPLVLVVELRDVARPLPPAG